MSLLLCCHLGARLLARYGSDDNRRGDAGQAKPANSDNPTRLQRQPARTSALNPLIIIPARLAASRLPGKPLADISGLPMIAHVCNLAAAAGVGPVLVAAAEPEIMAAARGAGYASVLTDPGLPSGSDRIAAALEIVDPDHRHDIIINLQGDVPTLPPERLRDVLAPLAQARFDIATLACEITDPAERTDPNTVKAVLAGEEGDAVREALYFSRSVVPSGDGPLWHHIGVYAYRRPALEAFVAAAPSPLERREKLEQLRALEIGLAIGCACVCGPAPKGVDTPADLEAARAAITASVRS